MPRKLLDEPYGLTIDVLYEIRKAQRALKRAEKAIIAHHRAVKRARAAKSNEWEESKRLMSEEIERQSAEQINYHVQED